MKQFIYRLFNCLAFALMFVLSLLPMRVLYWLSDAIYLLAYHLVGYRVKLVRRHLADSFPEKSEAERKSVEQGFYHWFCDYLVESIKLFSIGKKQIRQRMVFRGTEAVDRVIESGQSVAVYLGHFCNWEWITSLPLWVTEKAQCTQIYHPLENAEFDKLFVALRSRFGAQCVPMAETLRRIVRYRQQCQPIIMGYISDQVPFWNNIHHWLDFLHHDTPVLTGTEKIIRSTGQAAFYADVRCISRGHYECTFVPMQTDLKATAPWTLTDEYFCLLEQSIRRQPECYLWTHNRWKRTREEFNLRYDPASGRVNITDSVEELKRKATSVPTL